MKNSVVKNIVSAICYLLAFMAIQLLVATCVKAGWLLARGRTWDDMLSLMGNNGISLHSTIIILSSAISGALTIAIFAWTKWASVSRSYMKSKPWAVLAWVVVLTLGTIIPSMWVDEQLKLSMPSAVERLLAGIMSERWGYLAIGVLTPVAEEMVFRGAIQRVLQRVFSKYNHWLPIFISAIVFGAAHGNTAQFVHAFAMGTLLGWMYYRTDSVIPGVALHLVNNTVAFVLYNVMPSIADTKLVTLLGGQQRYVLFALLFSACVFFPALLQLSIRLKKPRTTWVVR